MECLVCKELINWGTCRKCIDGEKHEQKQKTLMIIDKAMKVSQKLKDAYIKCDKPTEKADYEIALWTEIRRRFEELL